MEYFFLFSSSFLAATLLPAFSEGLLFYLLKAGHSAYLLIFIASLGNTLGACLNWALGRYLSRFKNKLFSDKQYTKAQAYFLRYGQWSLLFTWLPVIGDPLTLVAGAMKSPFKTFVILVALGKCLRYCAIFGLYYWS